MAATASRFSTAGGTSPLAPRELLIVDRLRRRQSSFDRPRRGQGSREMLDGKVGISMKSSQHSFDNLLRIQLSPPCPQHLLKFDFARIEILRRHDEPDPEIMQD